MRAEGEQAAQLAGGVHGGEQPHRDVGNADNHHEVVDAKARVLVAEQVDPLHETLQLIDLHTVIVIMKYSTIA